MTVLKKIKHQIKPSSFTDYREYLHALYAAAKRADPKYSFLRMAQDLGFAPTNIIYQIIQGKRPLTLKTGQKIISGLELKGTDRRYFLGLINLKAWKNPEERLAGLTKLIEFKQAEGPRQIDADLLAYYSEWYHPVIREMIRLDDFKSDPHWIASVIVPRIRPEQAKESLKILERIGLIEFDLKSNRHVTSEATTSTGHEVQGVALMNFHAKMLDVAKAALTQTMPEHRDFSVVNISIARKTLPVVKAMIHAFQMQLLKLDDECNSRESALQINIQMFPNTKIED